MRVEAQTHVDQLEEEVLGEGVGCEARVVCPGFPHAIRLQDSASV